MQLVQQEQKSMSQEQRRQQMAIAATKAVSDYLPGSKLTVFTDLDGEPIQNF